MVSTSSCCLQILHTSHVLKIRFFLDWWFAAATVLDTVQTGIILHLVTLGLGASQDKIPLPQREQLGKVSWAPQISRIVLDPHQDVLHWGSTEATSNSLNRKVLQVSSCTSL